VVALGAFSSALNADEVRLADGRVLVGRVVAKDGGDTLEIETRAGVVTVARADVLGIRTDPELRAALRELGKGLKQGPHTSLQLARTALSYGLEAELWKHLDECLAQLDQTDEQPVRRQLERFVVTLAPEVVPARLRDAEPKHRVRGIVRSVRAGVGPGKRAAIVELLAHEPDADPFLREAAVREALPEQRLLAIQALAKRPQVDHSTFVTGRTILDDDAEVRRGAARQIAALGQGAEAVRRLVPGLMHDVPAIRIRTADALAGLNEPSAVPVLVAAGPLAGVPAAAAGNAGVRGHMFSLTTRAYIRDFDVEIAQAAAVANPVIGTVSNGVVLDVNVAAVITERVNIEDAYRRALRRLTGADPGRDPAGWSRWLLARDPEPAKQFRGP
jgi:hypothetical protein